jgi:4-amino-4-deoxy-L-arabinose transferase-like glycosyltransferase
LDHETPTRSARWVWPLLFCAYFGFQAIYRWILGGALGLDEAQMLLWSETLAWGYGSQPPLYTWIQWIVLHIVPDPLLALSLVKNTLLCGGYLAIYALLRTAHPPHRAGLATAALFLLPQVSWESLRALTHSVLAMTMAACAYLVFWTRALAGRRGGYVGFGAVVGLGLLSKANFAIVPAALLVTALTSGDWRRRIEVRSMALSGAVALAVAGGPLVWIWQNRERALGSTRKLERAGAEVARSLAALDGVAAVVLAVIGFLALPALVALVIRWRFGTDRNDRPRPELDRFLLRLQGVGLLLVLAFVLASGTTEVRDRWMQPVLFCAAPLIALWLLTRVRPAGERWYRRVVIFCAVLVTVILPIPTVTGTPGDPTRGGAPIEQIVAGLLTAYPEADHVIGAPEWLAGNLLYRHRGWRVDPLHLGYLRPREAALLVWSEDGAGEAARHIRRIAANSEGEVEIGAIRRFEAPYPWQPEQTFEVFAAPISRPPGSGG